MGERRNRMNKRLANQITTRRENSVKKEGERNRRETQMLALLKEGKFPYTRAIMNWVGEKLGKKTGRITEDDVQQIVK